MGIVYIFSNAAPFDKAAYQFSLPLANNCQYCQFSLPPFFLNANLMDGKYLGFVLIYIPLITSEAKYLFMS